ncbi:phosphotransferase family protein [Nocardia salmonicida]|uniref:phosphotransferase family protein n=1 Tax=Nocardia salmonicida TaxID=53431 RepID=UPI002E28DF5B|nr:phosphotransferase family protein [Nocardia salmonicida]
MDSEGLGRGAIERVAPIGGGTQNIMLRFERGGRCFVLRRGPKHLRPNTNDVLRREIRVLGALSGTEVAHPRLIAPCVDVDVLDGAVFYLMEPMDGFNASIGLPTRHTHDAGIRHRMGLEMVDALATLGQVDYLAAGLEDFGKPEGFLDRQVTRWLSELESYAAFADYPGPGISHIDDIADWLERNRPGDWAPGILHGDFHIANVMFSHAGPEVEAIVDWEMCTIGDPLLDLGWMLATWPEPDGARDPIGSAIARAGGLPTPSELVARYARRSDRDLSAVAWYTVLACFKLGIILEGTYARSFAGKASRSTGERLHASACELFESARRRIVQA